MITSPKIDHPYQDNWRIGITGLLAQSLGLVPFKNVFWSSRWAAPWVRCRRNPGNKFYYNCMEVAEDPDPNQPWALKYRYTGYMNTTRCGGSPGVPRLLQVRPPLPPLGRPRPPLEAPRGRPGEGRL